MGRGGRATVALFALLLAACTSKTPSARPASPWTRSDLKPITQPAAVDHRFILLNASGNDLQIVALDARTGKTVWTAAASTSDITPGEPPELILYGHSVLYLRPVVGASPDLATLVSARASDGRVEWQTAARRFNGWPSICSDDVSLVCATGPLGAGSAAKASLLRFKVSSGDLESGTAILSSEGARELAPGLFDGGDRHPEELVASAGAGMVWHKPLASIFTLPHASTDFGWNFARVRSPGLFIGTPGWPPVASTSRTYTLDLAQSMTAGFKIADGSAVWVDRGSQFVCGYIPCPGENLVPYRGPADASDPGPTIGLRLRMTGTVTGSQTSDALPKPSADARALLEGFDPATGETKWSFDAGHQVDLLNQALLPPLVGTESIIIAGKNGAVQLLDLSTGSASSPPDSLLAWCRDIVSYKHTAPGVFEDNGKPHVEEYVGQFGLFPCDIHQHRVAPPASAPGYVGSLGGSSDGLAAWSEASAVVAIRQAD